MRRCLLASARLTWRRQCRTSCARAYSLAQDVVRHSQDLHITTAAAQPSRTARRDNLLSRLDTHLRERSSINHCNPSIGELLVEGCESDEDPVDVLYELAVVNGRWHDAVWIAKQLLQSTRTLDSLDKASTQLIDQRSVLPALDDMTDNKLEEFRSLQKLVPVRQSESETIDETVLNEAFGIEPAHHRVLECIWRSIGMMIIACVRDHSISGGLVKQEVLEILALFHHNGLMPESVYTHLPDDRLDVVQQPATLYLLSSRIMTALTDAAWQAHEREMLAERYPFFDSTKHAGSAVRANIEGIKPEMWLELILWSSLQGGWVRAGADVLKAICDETNPSWRPISWRTTLRQQLDIGRTTRVNWDELSTLFSRTRGDSHEITTVQVSLTISSELVNAYVDACLSGVMINSDNKLSPSKVLHYLQAYRSFLQRSDLNLHAGNWEATIIRLVGSPTASVGDLALMSRLVEIAPHMGEELRSASEQAKPSHVLDATAALLGLLHQALQVQIDKQDLQGALTVFKLIWQCVDDARARSIEDFFNARVLDREETAESEGPFTSNVRIEYPAFDPAIPLQTSAAFIDFVLDRGAIRVFDSSMFNNNEYSLLPPQSQWGDPAVAPSLIRLAAARNYQRMVVRVNVARDQALATSNDALAETMANVSAALLESFATMNWTQAASILRYLETRGAPELDPLCISILGSTYMKLKLRQDHENTSRAWELLELMATTLLPRKLARTRTKYSEPQANMLKLMGIFDQDICRLSQELTSKSMHASVYVPEARCVNPLLDAVTSIRSYAGVRLLLEKLSFDGKASGDTVSIKDAMGTYVVIRRPFKPDITSLLVILRSCLKAGLSRGTVTMDESTALGAGRAVVQTMLNMLVVGTDRDAERASSILRQEFALQLDNKALEMFLDDHCGSVIEQAAEDIRSKHASAS